MDEELVQLAIVIRRDLCSRRGKEIAQGSHSAEWWLSDKVKEHLETGKAICLTYAERKWIYGSHKKIVFQVNTEGELLKVHEASINNGLRSILITDSGLTEFGGIPTNTAIGIGPDFSEKIQEITKTQFSLKLY